MSVNFSQETQAVTGTSNAFGAPLAYTELWGNHFNSEC